MALSTLLNSDSQHAFFKDLFQLVADPRKGICDFKAVDYCMSVFGMFKFKDPSLLAFEDRKADPIATANFKNIFGIEKLASDSMLRKYFDPIDPMSFKPIFVNVLKKIREEKLISQYLYLGNSILIATDGTTFYSSKKNFSPTCQTRKRKKKLNPDNENEVSERRQDKAKIAAKIGKKAKGHPAASKLLDQINELDDEHEIEYSLQMLTPAIVNPRMKTVIPLMPEPITGSDGTSKQDCETNACKRFLAGLRDYQSAEYEMTLLLDSLFSKSPIIHEIIGHGYNYIANAKPGDHATLFNSIKVLEQKGRLQTHVIKEDKVTKIYEWASSIPLFATADAPFVNFLRCTIKKLDGTQTVFTWVTNHELSKDSVEAIEKAGRARWKIENETFNTLKNHGYQFEHNFGLGQQFLAINFAIIMLIAFLSDQLLELTCQKFIQLLELIKTRRTLWEHLRMALNMAVTKSYEAILDFLFQRLKGTLPENMLPILTT